MKFIKKNLVALLLLVSIQLFSQTQPSVYAVISKAKWCSTCVKNEERVKNEVMNNIDTNKIFVVINDLSDKDTKASSVVELHKKGLGQLKLKSTGVISFINAKTKKVISTISVSKPTDEILKEFSKVASL